MISLLRRVLCLCAFLAMPTFAHGHALDPGYLSLTEVEENQWRAFWRKPDVKGAPMRLEAVLPDSCGEALPPRMRSDGAAWTAEWDIFCATGLTGKSIRIDGLEATQTDVLLRISPLDQSTQTVRLVPTQTIYEIPETFTTLQVFTNYLALGYEHILEGFDHLLFVFALLLLVQTPRKLIGAVTAFTLAHSITLAMASVGILTVPGPPVESVIALSIVFLALEIIRQKQDDPSLTQKYPWIVAFSFGLLHGLGFAGALSDIGLPDGDIPMALLAFNVGVELGQLTFVLGVLGVFIAILFASPKIAETLRRPRGVALTTMGYAIGVVSIYWLMERLISFPIFAT